MAAAFYTIKNQVMDIYTFYYGYFIYFKLTSPYIQRYMFVLIIYCFTDNIYNYIIPDIGSFRIYYISVWGVAH